MKKRNQSRPAMETTVSLTVNGEQRSLSLDPLRPLLEVLREELHLTGTKYGCGESQCGACTVLLDGRSIRSCVTPVAKANHREVTTIEGISKDGSLHPVQEAFLAENAYQCGYCTPGMIMELVGLLREHPVPPDAEIVSRMEEHLCRCCGYPNILKAIRRSAAEARS